MARRGPASRVLEVVEYLGGADVPLGTLLWFGHGVVVLLAPLVLALSSFASALVAEPLSDIAPAVGPTLLAFMHSDPSAGSDADAETGAEATRPVPHLYRVTFGDEEAFRIWAERVIEFTSGLEDLEPDQFDPRPVVFVQLRPRRGTPPVAYVSAGARGLATSISGGAKVDASPVAMWQLPDGLTMLFGDGVDAAAYERRAPSPPDK